jgi:anaerobic magnesium-protoporphyrin IX monomethyl ester cyclase
MNTVIEKNKFRILLVYPNLPLMLVPPLSIALFTRILEDQGYEVDLFDTTGYLSDESVSPENRVKFLQARTFKYKEDLGIEVKENLLGDFREKVQNFNPNVMMFSVVEDSFRLTLKMLYCIKDIKIPHILGGVFPTSAPDLCMTFDNIKVVGVGEGEKIIVDFAESIRLNTPLSDVRSIQYKDENNKIHINTHNCLIDINEIKPDFRLFDEERFYRPMGGRIFKTFPVETYRGCPYTCAYCNSPFNNKLSKQQGQRSFLRRKSIPCIKEELTMLRELYGPEFIYFIDDSFTARPNKEMFEFCDMYEEFSLPFWFNTRPEISHANVLKRLKEVGCYRTSYGIECGNEQFRRKILKRDCTNKKLIEQFDIIANSEIAFSINLIIGFPGETRDLIMDTVRFVKQIRGYDAITVSMFTPYHGTELRKVAEKNQWLSKESTSVHTTSSSMLDMPQPYVNSLDLDGLIRVMTLYCYFPESEWANIERAEKDDEEGNKVLQHYSGIYKDKFFKSTQDDKKELLVPGGSGCCSNYKDSLKINAERLTEEQIKLLTC